MVNTINVDDIDRWRMRGKSEVVEDRHKPVISRNSEGWEMKWAKREHSKQKSRRK